MSVEQNKNTETENQRYDEAFPQQVFEWFQFSKDLHTITINYAQVKFFVNFVLIKDAS